MPASSLHGKTAEASFDSARTGGGTRTNEEGKALVDSRFSRQRRFSVKRDRGQ